MWLFFCRYGSCSGDVLGLLTALGDVTRSVFILYNLLVLTCFFLWATRISLGVRTRFMFYLVNNSLVYQVRVFLFRRREYRSVSKTALLRGTIVTRTKYC